MDCKIYQSKKAWYRYDDHQDHNSLITAINNKNLENVKFILSHSGIKINEVDEDGMTALQHACFKGCPEIVDLLLSVGSDVNSNDHKMGYTALMFAALSGDESIILKLLNAGSKTYRTNSVGRTASQMAAFIGNHRASILINNYIEKSNIASFSTPNGINQDIRLQPSLVNAVHKLVNDINFSPVKICMTLRDEYLISHWKNVSNVLDVLCRQNFDPHNTNEGLSIKFHLISIVCTKAGNAYENGDEMLNKFIRMLLKGAQPLGLPEGQEKILRQGLKEFVFIESQLYRIIINELYKIPMVNHPTALEILSNKINGQIFFNNPNEKFECSACFSYSKNVKKCSACSEVSYCNVECQKMHWFTHKKFCNISKGRTSESVNINQCGDVNETENIDNKDLKATCMNNDEIGLKNIISDTKEQEQ